MPWKPLTPTLLKPATLERADPYLRMADATGFVDHWAEPARATDCLPISVELKAGASVPGIDGLCIPPAYTGCRFFTADATPSAVNALLAHPDVVRLQFAEGVLPQRPPRRNLMSWARHEPPPPREDSRKPTPLLIGVIDSGCPFARADLRTPDGRSTRVVRLWDQEAGPIAAPKDMGYGQEYTGADLNGWMDLATTQGQLDEHACYMMAGADHVLAHASHGSHALGLLAGPLLVGGWKAKPGTAESTQSCGAREADIAFVQLPRKLLNASFPPAVEHHAIDALRYLFGLAKERNVEHLLVSFAFESWVGPHDGSSWFDKAVEELKAQAGDMRFDLVLVAGNAGCAGDLRHTVQAPERSVHLQLDSGARRSRDGLHHAKFHWQVQPDNQAVTYLELWVPDEQSLSDLKLDLTPPSMTQPLPSLEWGAAVAWPNARSPAVCVIMDKQSKVLGCKANVVVLRISPTRTFDGRQQAAPHGEWSIGLRTSGSLSGIHVYIGRGGGSQGAQVRGRQSTLTRRTQTQRELDRFGSLNGHACTQAQDVWIASSCISKGSIYQGNQSRLQAGKGALYAGAGPSRDCSSTNGPTFAVAFEQGPYHRGWIGFGNRSAVRFRLVGTSVAGPLGARSILEGTPATPTVTVDPENGRAILDPV